MVPGHGGLITDDMAPCAELINGVDSSVRCPRAWPYACGGCC